MYHSWTNPSVYLRRIRQRCTDWFSAVFFTGVTEYITYKPVEHYCSEQWFVTRSLCLLELIIIRLTFTVKQSVNVIIKETSIAAAVLADIYFHWAALWLVELIRTKASIPIRTDLRIDIISSAVQCHFNVHSSLFAFWTLGNPI